MVTGVAGMLTVIGEHFWLVVIACICGVSEAVVGDVPGKRKENRLQSL